jgi:hypothetical protein
MKLDGFLGVGEGFFTRFARSVATGNIRYAYTVGTVSVVVNCNWKFHFKPPWLSGQIFDASVDCRMSCIV